jgi:hypothetical protein
MANSSPESELRPSTFSTDDPDVRVFNQQIGIDSTESNFARRAIGIESRCRADLRAAES